MLRSHTSEHHVFVRARVASGAFASQSEVVRAGLRAILGLCEKYGAENFQVPRRVLEDGIAEDERNLVRLVVDSDPERIYPVTAKLGSRIGELSGIHVWLDELPWFRSSSSPSAKKYVPLEPLLLDTESGSSPQSEKGR